MVSASTDRFDGAQFGQAIKNPCVAVSITNLTLSGEQTVNGVACTEGDRVLVAAQTDDTENGIYTCETGAWNRALDFDGNRDIVQGTLVTVNRTSGKNYFWQVTSSNPITIGTSSITLIEADGPNASWDLTTDESNGGLTTSDVDTSYQPYEGERYGMVEDGGTTDNATPFANAIIAADQSGQPLILRGGNSYYDIGSAITQATLSNPLKIIGIGSPVLKYSGAATDYVLQITDTNGNDVTFENVIIDADQKASTVARVDNPSASMADANIGQVRIKDTLLKNGWLSATTTYAATGLTVSGGFSEVILDNVTIRNIDRATGAGTAGSIGCAGALIIYDDINAYVKKLTVIGGHIDTITNNESTGAGDDVDCDGINYSTPTATENGGFHLPASMVCWGTKFSNCKGRNVKTQLDGFTIIRDFTVVRDLEEAVNNARDFDLTRGGGIIDGGVYYSYEIGQTLGGGSTWGSSHAIVGWGPDQLATDTDNADGGLSVRDIKIYGAIPTATDDLPFFCLITNDTATRELLAFNLKDCAIMGGQINRWVKVQNAGTAQDLNITIEGCEGDTVTSLILFNATVDAETKLVASRNRNTRAAGTPKLLEFASGDSEPYLSGYNNTGYVKSYLNESASSTMSEIFRPSLIGGDTRDGHVFATAQTLTLADDASDAFSATGSYGIGIITNDFSDAAQAIFVHDANSFVEIYQAGATSAVISYGTTTNPDTDGDLNIWITGNDTINIKNRLGSSQTFHFWHFGGN